MIATGLESALTWTSLHSLSSNSLSCSWEDLKSDSLLVSSCLIFSTTRSLIDFSSEYPSSSKLLIPFLYWEWWWDNAEIHFLVFSFEWICRLRSLWLSSYQMQLEIVHLLLEIETVLLSSSPNHGLSSSSEFQFPVPNHQYIIMSQLSTMWEQQMSCMWRNQKLTTRSLFCKLSRRLLRVSISASREFCLKGI